MNSEERVEVCEGDRVYYVSNRAEVVALDTKGFADGNQGYQDEIYNGPQDGRKIPRRARALR